jgi:glycosyltransferase involved in cell wall biosynthesis
MSPTVSIILPTYNRAHLLPRAIRSVLAQSYEDYELIVIDDASQDETPKIMAAMNDKRIRYIREDVNIGVAAARNRGILACQGKYVAFQDSDDEWHPQKLVRQIQAFTRVDEETAVVYSQFWRKKAGRIARFPPASPQLSGDILSILRRQNVVTTQAALVRRACLKEVGLFDAQLSCLVDWELWLRLSQHYRFQFVAEPLVVVHFTPQSISSQTEAVADALEYILDKHATLFLHDDRSLAHHHYQLGHLHMISRDQAAGLKHFAIALKLAPITIRYRLVWGLAHLGVNSYTQIYRWKEAILPGWY